MILDIPHTKVFVRNLFIKPDGLGLTEAYLFAVTCLLNRPLLFTFHTIDGAIYSRLPLWAFMTKPCNSPPLNRQDCEPWSVLGTRAQVIQHAYLKDYAVYIPNLKTFGRYLFTIDYLDGGFSQDPEQHKTSNIISLDSGHLVSLPNNYLIAKDKHFTGDAPPIPYKRNTFYFLSE